MFTAWRSSGGRTRLRFSSLQISLDHLQGGGRHRRSSPKCLQRGGRLKGGCAFGPPPAESCHVAIFRVGDAAGDPPPSIYSVTVVRGEDAPAVAFSPRTSSRCHLQGGTEDAPPALLPPTFTAWRSSGGEDAPPVPFSANLATWPSSGRVRGCAPALLPPIFTT